MYIHISLILSIYNRILSVKTVSTGALRTVTRKSATVGSYIYIITG